MNNGQEQVLKATGGGSHLYYDKLSKRLPGIVVQKEDEMECLITGRLRLLELWVYGMDSKDLLSGQV